MVERLLPKQDIVGSSPITRSKQNTVIQQRMAVFLCSDLIQAMLGHASLDMVQHYAQMVDDDLLQSHKAHSPMDNLTRLK